MRNEGMLEDGLKFVFVSAVEKNFSSPKPAYIDFAAITKVVGGADDIPCV